MIPTHSTLNDGYQGYDPVKPIHHILQDRSSSNLQHFVTESPVDCQSAHSYRDDHDMEHCSEQDDIQEREHGEEDNEEEDDDEEENSRTKKVARHTSGGDTKAKSVTKSLRNNDTTNLDGASSSSTRKPSLTNSPKTSKKPTRGKSNQSFDLSNEYVFSLSLSLFPFSLSLSFSLSPVIILLQRNTSN
jgi:hypothetical protein